MSITMIALPDINPLYGMITLLYFALYPILEKGGDTILILLGVFIALITFVLLVIFFVNIILFYLKKKSFPKKWLIATLSGIVIVSSIYVNEVYFFTFNKIDREYLQEGPGPVISPTEVYMANAYYEPYGGAAGGVNVWVEITHNNKENKVQTVYYADAKTKFSMEWLDDETLYIVNVHPEYPNSNRSVKLQIGKEIYHETGLACQSLLMKRDYETCYQETNKRPG